MKNYVIGIDQGTTGTLVGMMDPQGRIIRRAYQEHQQFYPGPGRVEHDPHEIWRNVCALFNRVVDGSGIDPDQIAGVGIANQGESVVLWDSHSGQPLSQIIVWQDTRSQESMNEVLADEAATREIKERTGLRPDAYFSASKMRWLLDHTPGVDRPLKDGHLKCGTLDSWLIWNLTQGRSCLTDVSTASRTLLFNVGTLDWDEWLLAFFGIPREILADVVETVGDFGAVTHPDIDARGIPILASLVDQPAAMVGQGCLRPHTIKATYGTGCFINLNTGREAIISSNDLLTLVAWQREGAATYGLDGGVFSAGASLNWLRDKAGMIKEVAEIESLCQSVPDSGGVVWVPAQVGLGAPYWERDIRGAWVGIDLAAEKAHLVRAVLEGIALRVAQIIRAMELDSGKGITRLRADGGLTRNRAMMQIQADALGIPVEVLDEQEATLKGVCGLAARTAGIWTADEQISAQVKVARTYEPAGLLADREARLAAFEHAISLLKSWPYARD